MDFETATRSYERWMAEHTEVVTADLREKHRRLAESPFVFLRGTFYRWVQLWPTICAALADAPTVLSVGDHHVENFGTWRDAEGRLVWGVNDLDEAAPLPYTNDLVRLATSALLAVNEQQLGLSVRAVCEAILEGYSRALAYGGNPIVLAERHSWLRQIAQNELRDPARFWDKLASNSRVARPPRSLARHLTLPRGATGLRFFRRRAGVGSLGRPRYVVLGTHLGGFIAREAKALIPSATAWASGRRRTPRHNARLLARAIRVPDPFFSIAAGWTVRRLSPDCLKIEVGELPGQRDETKLLKAMGWETANIHLGTATAATLRAHLKAKRGSGWLQRAAADMAEVVLDEHRAWCSRRADR